MTKLIPNLVLGSILMVCFAGTSKSYPYGAPVEACLTMTPAHGFEGQETPSPYTITLSTNKVKPGKTIDVVLATTGIPFKGFLAMGFNVKNETTGVGDMLPGGEDPVLTLSCPTGTAMTHATSGYKLESKLKWKAPHVSGDYVILATFVQDFTMFWVKQRSAVIEVKTEV